MRKAIQTLLLVVAGIVSPADRLLNSQSTPTFMFTEIMYDAPDSDEGREWVEVYNFGTEPVTVSVGSTRDSFRFYDGAFHTLNLAQGTTTIPGGGFAVLADDASAWAAEHPDFSGTLFDTVMSLKNSSSTIGFAVSASDGIFTEVMYDASWGASGNGYALQRATIQSQENTPADWTQGKTIGGTPGYWEQPSDDSAADNPPDDGNTNTYNNPPPSKQNEPLDAPPPLLINELLPNPAGSDSAEFIEVYNDGPAAVDLIGWKLRDARGPYTIKVSDFESPVIAGYGFFVLTRERTKIALNNSRGDSVALIDSHGRYVDSVFYEGTVPENQSWSRFDDSWQWTEPTPGSLNRLAYKPGPDGLFPETILEQQHQTSTPIIFYEGDVLITELYQNPPGKDTHEWIEIKNSTTTPVDLFGWQLDDAPGGSRPYVFTTSTVIEPGRYFIVYKQDSKIALNNSEDTVRLIDPFGAVLAQSGYSRAPEGRAWAFDEDREEWFWASSTPGFAFRETTTTAVLGYEMVAVAHFDEITEEMIGSRVRLTGIVIVQPRAVRKSTMYLAEIPDTDARAGVLLEVFQYRGLFPKLLPGDRISVEGTVEWNAKPRLKIEGPDAISLLGHGATPQPLAVDLFDVTESEDDHWVSIQADVYRVNAKSLSLGDASMRLLVYPPEQTKLAGYSKGTTVRVSGFLQYHADKPILRLASLKDIEVIPKATATTTADGGGVADITLTAASRKRQWLYLATLPVALGIGFLLKKSIASKLQ